MKRFRLAILGLILVVLGAGRVNGAVKLGVDVLVESNFASLQGKRVALLTNRGAWASNGLMTGEAMRRAGINLVALFAPAHGFNLFYLAGERTNDERTADGVPIFAFYSTASKRDAAQEEAWKKIEVMVIDLQDIGVRYYTYGSSMLQMMFECFRRGIEVYVLDRPNPLSGTLVGGPCLDEGNVSFLGEIPQMPMIHGLTMGEIALYAKDYASKRGLIIYDPVEEHECHNRTGLTVTPELASRGVLKVIPMEGWRREMTWDDTGLVFHQLSPRIVNCESCYSYAVLSLLAECYRDLFTFVVTGYSDEIPSSANHFSRFYSPRSNFQDLLYKLQHVPYNSAARGIRISRSMGDGNLYLTVNVYNIRQIEPGAMALFFIASTQKEQNWKNISEFRKMMLYSHIGDSELCSKVLKGEAIDFVYFLGKWQRQAGSFRQRVSPFLLYR